MSDSIPSLQSLNLASVVAALVMVLLGTTVILPAEFAIDPTGVGQMLGLQRMGLLKQGAVADPNEAYEQRTDTLTFALDPGKGTEVKVQMQAGQTLIYDWKTSDNQPVYIDFHGEPQGEKDAFSSYKQLELAWDEGQFETPFEGMHGWYFLNKGAKPVQITLTTSGVYRAFGQR